MQWPFSSNSTAPQLLSFSAGQDERHMIQFDPVSSTRFDFELNRNNYPVSQVASLLEKRGLPSSSTTSPSIHQFVEKSGQNHVASISSPALWPLARVPVTTCGTPFVGTTDLRSASKTSSAPSQLTIFYNGCVSVYDNISPEKAQAIMLLAGNGPPQEAPVTVLPPVPGAVTVTEPYGGTMNQGYYSSSSRPDLNYAPESDSATRFEALDLPQNALISGAISQLRRKSLARFVEKRQQRVMSMGMQYSGKQNEESSSSDRVSFVLNSQDLSSVFDPTQIAVRP